MKLNKFFYFIILFLTIMGINSGCSSGVCQVSPVTVELNPGDGGITNGESNVSLTPLIVITFSTPMDPSTINTQTVFLSTIINTNKRLTSSNQGSIIPISQIVASNNNMTFSFSSQSPLQQNTTYYITLTSQIKSAAGVPIVATQFNFTTGIFDYPMVTMTSPVNNESNIAVESNIYFGFNESVYNVNSSNVELHAGNQTNNLVPSSITNISGNNYKIAPTEPLNYSTTYYVVFKSGIINSESNALTSQTFNFSTLQMPIGDIWMGGTKQLDQDSIYGDLGIPNVNNQPGGRELSAHWVDKQGNFWLFGGESYSYLNDMWMYNHSAKTWVWVSGSKQSNQSGSYGTKGLSSVRNIPGSRSGAMYWTDADGNFWLFGGYGYDINGNLGYLSDLWQFNPDNLTWTWVAGNNIVDQSGVYGTQGVASPSNLPSARDSGATWVDAQGNFWLFGGCSVVNVNQCQQINDLWKYDRSKTPNQWVWVGGNNTTRDLGNYGIKGSESAGNIPGARDASVTWVDNQGNLWLFGGYNGSGFNDLWKYNMTTQMWSWISGSDLTDQSGVYGTKGVESITNIPGSREDSISWVDSQGNFWLFGGSGTDMNGYGGQLNDLWRYNISTNSWTWISGFRVFGIASNYGQQGIYGGTGVVVSAREAAMGWLDSQGNFWLFGGKGYATQSYPSHNGYLNDLWLIKTP